MAGPGTLLAHLEESLGTYGGKGVVEPEWNVPFSVLRFDGVPEQGVVTLVTFGLSDHVLAGADGAKRRQELLLSLRQPDLALDLAVSVAMYVLERHVAVLEGEIVNIPAELRGSLAQMVAALPDHLDAALGRWETPEGAVEIIWLLPFALDESHVPIEHGWRALLDWLRSSGADPYDLRRASLV